MSDACPDCEQARRRPFWPIQQASCIGCQTRALAQGPEMFRSAQARRIQPAYAKALRTIFGDDYVAGHERVKAMAEMLRMVNEGARFKSSYFEGVGECNN